MTIINDEEDILTLQKMYGVDKMQDFINSGEIWKQKYINILVKQCIENGICFIPLEMKDNNIINLNYSFENSQKFWSNICCGDVVSLNKLEILFGVKVL